MDETNGQGTDIKKIFIREWYRRIKNYKKNQRNNDTRILMNQKPRWE